MEDIDVTYLKALIDYVDTMADGSNIKNVHLKCKFVILQSILKQAQCVIKEIDVLIKEDVE